MVDSYRLIDAWTQKSQEALSEIALGTITATDAFGTATVSVNGTDLPAVRIPKHLTVTVGEIILVARAGRNRYILAAYPSIAPIAAD